VGKILRKRTPRRRWVCGYVGGSFGAFERQNQSDYTNVVERMFKRKVTQDRGKRLRGTFFETQDLQRNPESRAELKILLPFSSHNCKTKEWRVTKHKLQAREQVKLDDLIRRSSTGWGNRIKK
jgi:hypothetical protein